MINFLKYDDLDSIQIQKNYNNIKKNINVLQKNIETNNTLIEEIKNYPIQSFTSVIILEDIQKDNCNNKNEILILLNQWNEFKENSIKDQVYKKMVAEVDLYEKKEMYCNGNSTYLNSYNENNSISNSISYNQECITHTKHLINFINSLIIN